MPSPNNRRNTSRYSIRLGYVALADCAPVAVASETGLFERHGLNVKLSRELGWASVRDRIYYGELDAAEAISGIAFSLSLGTSGIRRSVAVPIVLNLHGNAITLSKHIDRDMIRQGGLKTYLKNHWKKDRPFTMAVTHRYSSHHILLTQWLRKQGVAPDRDLEILFIPPPLMPGHLRAGHIDGYCVGEPWNSESILSGIGWCPITSAELSHGHPEKVLLVSDQFLEEHEDETTLLVRSLLEACQQCQDPAFRNDLIDILSLPRYTNSSREILSNSLGTSFHDGYGSADASTFHVFHGKGVNEPSTDKASWTLSGLRNAGVIDDRKGMPLSQLYREDLFQASCR